MPSSSMDRPTSAGATSKTSRSPVATRESVNHGDDESTHAIQPDFFMGCRIEFAEKQEPRLWNALMGTRRQGVLPSCPCADSSVQRHATGVRAATLVQPVSSNRGRTYPHRQDEHFPKSV